MEECTHTLKNRLQRLLGDLVPGGVAGKLSSEEAARVLKAEAVRLVRSSSRSISQIAKDLGVSGNSLRTWAKQSEINQGEREGLTTEEREELKRLRREVKILRQEKEILKKAAA